MKAGRGRNKSAKKNRHWLHSMKEGGGASPDYHILYKLDDMLASEGGAH